MRLLKGITLLIAIISGFSHAEIYRWVDANGQVHYSDKPRDGATKVELDANRLNTIEMNAPSPKPAPTKQPEKLSYNLQLLSPADQATVRNNNGELDIRLSLTPELEPDHRIQVLMDGSEIGSITSAEPLSINLDNLVRGEHKLQAKVLDQSGKVLASTDQRTFYLFRQSRLIPPVQASGGN